MVYHRVGVTAGTSSFGSAIQEHLDPNLFSGGRMLNDVREHLLSVISAFMSSRYSGPHYWLRVWMAGSGASYRWNSSPALSDLDMLLGIDWVAFRQHNPSYRGIGDQEMASHMNEELREELWPTMASWKGRYEVTWYVNANSDDIRRINPYAAYDLVEDRWVVEPSREEFHPPQDWRLHVAAVGAQAGMAIDRYSAALETVQRATHPVARRNAEVEFNAAVDQAVALYDTVHNERRAAFSPTGGGYADLANYRWQEGKRAGWIPALRTIKDYRDRVAASNEKETYGMELPDHDLLVRRAAMSRLTP